jgi:hypothetical protein
MKSMHFVKHQPPLDRIGRELGSLGKFAPLISVLEPRQPERQLRPEGKGYIFCGPRHSLRRGKYFAYFWINVGEDIVSPRLVFDAVSWQDNAAITVGQVTADLTAGPKRITLFVLCFELRSRSLLEVRAWSDENGGELTVGRIEIRRVEEWRLGMQGDLKIAPPMERKWFRRGDPGSFEAILRRGREAEASPELWLAYRPVVGNAHIHLEPTSSSGSLIELVAAANARQFMLKDGRIAMIVPLPREGRQARDNRITVRLNQSLIKLDVLEEESYPIAHLLSLRATGAADVDAAGTAVRLKLCGLGEELNPPPIKSWIGIGEQRQDFIELRKDSVAEFTASDSGFFLFGTGPDCGIAELKWGPFRCHINLFERTPGAVIVFVPEDVAQIGAKERAVTLSARQRDDGRQATADAVDIMVLGHKHPASLSTEMSVQNLWANYPLRRLSFDTVDFTGDQARQNDGIVVWRGAGRFWGGEMPAIQLIRHQRGGLCAIAHRERLIIVDLYAIERESILVLPAAPEPILSARPQERLRGAEIVHPALAHLFRRMRPSWLLSEKGYSGYP